MLTLCNKCVQHTYSRDMYFCDICVGVMQILNDTDKIYTAMSAAGEYTNFRSPF